MKIFGCQTSCSFIKQAFQRPINPQKYVKIEGDFTPETKSCINSLLKNIARLARKNDVKLGLKGNVSKFDDEFISVNAQKTAKTKLRLHEDGQLTILANEKNKSVSEKLIETIKQTIENIKKQEI